MIWWRGNGLWMGILVALFVMGGNQLGGPRGVPLGLLAAAILLYLMRSALEESSLYSIPARFWPPLLFVLSVLCYLSGRQAG